MFKGNALSVQMLDAGIAEMKFDLQGESVNKFNGQTISELDQAISELEKASELKGLLITSGKNVFIVGADITEFNLGGDENPSVNLGSNNDNLNRIEDLKVPTVVAINGYAMGGGLELTLACDFRIMSTAAKIGLPETKLGIIPGWGGTVRLPRIAGADTAIEWIASGKEQRPATALKAGVVDGVVEPDQLQSAALKVLQNAIDGKMDYESRRIQKKSPLKLNDIEAMMSFETAKAFVAGQAGPNYPAPVTAIKCMQKAAKLGRDEALEVEKEGFAKMAKTSVAEALIGLFLSDQLIGKKAKEWKNELTRRLKARLYLVPALWVAALRINLPLKAYLLK